MTSNGCCADAGDANNNAEVVGAVAIRRQAGGKISAAA
jgi:hypothetical protein